MPLVDDYLEFLQAGRSSAGLSRVGHRPPPHPSLFVPTTLAAGSDGGVWQMILLVRGRVVGGDYGVGLGGVRIEQVKGCEMAGLRT